MKKTLRVLLGAVLVLSLLLAGITAAGAVTSGVEATIAAGTNSLAAGASTPITLTMNSVDPDNCKVTATITTTVGTLTNATRTFRLNAGATDTLVATLSAPGAATRTVPNTGDRSLLFVWLGLAALSGGALLVLARKGKKLGGKGLLSLLVCLVLLAAFGTPAPRVAATSGSVTVNTTVTVNGTPATVTGTVSWEPLTAHTWTVQMISGGDIVGEPLTGTAYFGDPVSVTVGTAGANQFSGDISGLTPADLSVTAVAYTTGTAGSVAFTMPDADVSMNATCWLLD